MTKSVPILGLLPLLLPVAALAADPPLDVRGVQLRQEGLKVVEKKCLVCHNRQRIDAAANEQKDLSRILKRMEKKGVALTAKDRQVIGHFWRQDPFKSR